MRLAQWARLLTPGRLGLRAGAWYSVVSRTSKEVQLAVRGRTVTVARALVELRDTPPSEWTVVTPTGGRDSYLVCPGCRYRDQLPDRHVDTLRCPRCNAAFAIAWRGIQAPAPLEGLKPDRRITPRRSRRERRSGRERRAAGRAIKVTLPRRKGDRRGLLDRRRRAASR